MDRQTTNTRREPNEFVRKAAQAYNEKYGFGRIVEDIYFAVDLCRARRIADAFETLPVDDSARPRVRGCYDLFTQEVDQQWTFAIEKIGIIFQPWPSEGQPYTSSFEMFRDVRTHRHLFFFQGGDPHPYLSKIDPETGLSTHDKFRAIHDLFGHAAEAYGFGPRGEENAWINHSQMFSTEAQRAITTETRGHNCWFNFGAHNYDSAGNHKNIPLKDRPYAVQKAALLPTEFMDFRAVMESSLNIGH